MSKRETHYLSLDIETDGPVPGLNSMLSLGAAHFDSEGNLISSFSCNLKELEGASPNVDTMKWWATQPKGVWEEARENAVHPSIAILEFSEWIPKFNESAEIQVVPIAWPASFDFPFINYYGWKFLGRAILGYACLDIRSYLMGYMKNKHYYQTKHSDMIKEFGEIDTSGLRDHVAVDDAISQGRLFFHIRDSGVK